MSNNVENQITDDVYEFLNNLDQKAAKLPENKLGTGLFLIPDPEAGILEEKVVAVEDIGLIECTKRASNCIAFKWAPYAMVSKEELKDIGLQGCGWCGPRRNWCGRRCICGGGNYCKSLP